MKMLEEFPILARVANYAGTKHAGQTRADGATPYITHPVAVAQMLYNDFAVRDTATLAAALLHDVLEDTPTTRLDLETFLLEGASNNFNGTVAYVEALTKAWTGKGPQPQNPETKAARHLTEYRKLTAQPAPVRLIKVADRIHNLQTSFCYKPPRDRRWQAGYLADTALLIGVLTRAARTIPDSAAVDALKREYWRCVLDFTRPEET